MEISERFGFNLPSRNALDDIADINQISDNFRIIDREMVTNEDVNELVDTKANLEFVNLEIEELAYVSGLKEGAHIYELKEILNAGSSGAYELYFTDGTHLIANANDSFKVGKKYLISTTLDPEMGYVFDIVAECIDLEDKVNITDFNEALANFGGGSLKDYELLCDTTITEDVSYVKWTIADNGEPIGNYKDFFIYFLGKFTAEESKALWCKSEGQYFMWATFAKKTSVKGFWISIEQIFSTDEIDSTPNASTIDGTAIFISKYPKLFLSNITEGQLYTQGLVDNNQDLRCDTSIMGTSDLPLKELQIGQPAASTAIFASGSRFLLLGRKA